jgi:hypothetical protein
LILLRAGPDLFSSIDRSTVAAIPLGGGTLGANDNGMAYDSENNVHWVGSWNSQTYEYDASFNRIATYGQSFVIDGMAFVATGSSVPEPGTWPLLAGGLSVSWLLLRRRQSR